MAPLRVALASTALLSLVQASRRGFDQLDRDKNGQIDPLEWEAFHSRATLGLAPLFAKDDEPERVIPGQETAEEVAEDVLEHIPEVVGLGFVPAFVKSLAMIIVTELGDKTFFIGAVLAMKHPRYLVFAGAISALAIMTVLSTMVGYTLPSLLPRSYTHFASAVLFLYFGIKLLWDSRQLENGPSDELREVEEELIHKKDQDTDGNGVADDPENGRKKALKKKDSSAGGGSVLDEQAKVFAQSFTLTFLAEWGMWIAVHFPFSVNGSSFLSYGTGDRSQIATIALASAKDPFGVTAGGVIGHAICTGLAVVGGRILAARISEKTVSIVGGALFLVFAVHAFIWG